MSQAQVAELQARLIEEYAQAPGMFGELARIEALLAETYRERAQYELLQNSDDAGSTEVNITVGAAGEVTWRNNGRELLADDIESLCRSASSTKSRGDFIGYRGIGFKSVAGVARRVTVTTSGCRFDFDRTAAAAALTAAGHPAAPDSVPLIRIPCDMSDDSTVRDGVSFYLDPIGASVPVLAPIDPVALLFLRSIELIRIGSANGRSELRRSRIGDRVELVHDAASSTFGILEGTGTTVAVPLCPRARAITGVAGRLSCFLPLEDQVGMPVIISGDLLTDPSRTHANTADPSTRRVLAEAARIVAAHLADPASEWCDPLWELLLNAPDPRVTLASPSRSTEYLFLDEVRQALRAKPPSFSIAPFTIAEEDIVAIFPAGAPKALYRPENIAAARAVRVAFRLAALDPGREVAPSLDSLSPKTIESAGHFVAQTIAATGRRPTPAEQNIISVGSSDTDRPVSVPLAEAAPRVRRAVPKNDGFESVMQRWRVAEVAVCEWLNSRGWQLVDVSKQNIGYDIEGIDPDGRRMHLEVKKVDRPDSRFTMTNNELGATQSGAALYRVIVVIGDGASTRLAMVDPTDPALPRDRVCRAWEWQFSAWADHAQLLN